MSLSYILQFKVPIKSKQWNICFSVRAAYKNIIFEK